MLVCGIKNRNRATHGDTVVVELLPRSEWQGRVTGLAEGHGDEGESKTMPTGQSLCLIWGGRRALGQTSTHLQAQADGGSRVHVLNTNGRFHRPRCGDPAAELEGLCGYVSSQGCDPIPEQDLQAHPGGSLGSPHPKDPRQLSAGRRAAGPLPSCHQRLRAAVNR